VNSQPSVTVAILTYNGEKYLRSILDRLRTQQYGGTVEVLVVDSGSQDQTLSIISGYPEVRLHEIPNTEFGHGRTRNLAADLAQGEIVAYLTHDAVPADDLWLAALVEPMIDDERVMAVMGKQIPRPGCFPLLKYEIQAVFSGLGPDFGTTIFRDNGFLRGVGERDAAAFYSDVNSAARRSILLGAVPYRDVLYAEDQLFGRDLIDAGYRKAYAPRAAVDHSNDLTLRESGTRIFEEVVGLREIGTDIPVMSRRTAVRLAVRGSIADSLRIVRDSGFGLRAKLRWLAINPSFHWAKWSNYCRATQADVRPYVSAPQNGQ